MKEKSISTKFIQSFPIGLNPILRKKSLIYRLHEPCSSSDHSIWRTRRRSTGVRTRKRMRMSIWVASESSGLPWNVVRGVFEGSSKSLSNPSTPPWLPRVSHASTSTRSAASRCVTPREVNTQRTKRSSDISFFIYRASHLHVTSPFVNGCIPRKVVAHIFCMKCTFLSQLSVKDVLDLYSYK